MIDIKVLGSGCPNCKRLEAVTQKVIESMGVEAEIEKVTDVQEIMKWSVLSTPGLVINGKVMSSGRIPNEAEITAWLSE